MIHVLLGLPTSSFSGAAWGNSWQPLILAIMGTLMSTRGYGDGEMITIIDCSHRCEQPVRQVHQCNEAKLWIPSVARCVLRDRRLAKCSNRFPSFPRRSFVNLPAQTVLTGRRIHLPSARLDTRAARFLPLPPRDVERGQE